MKNFLAFIFSITMLNAAFACGNEYGYTLSGVRQYTEYFYLTDRMKSFDTVEIKKKLASLQSKVDNGTANFKTWSDIALNMMKTGRADSAVKILQPLYKEHPKEYNIVANLGTAYELTGKLDSALKYIKEDLIINPKSHLGSEWIHVKILEAKIKERDRPGWMDTHPVISVDELMDAIDTMKHNRGAYLLNHNLFYQIRTRAPFTPAPDKVLASLLTTLGDFNMKAGTYENALLAYVYAMQFHDKFNLKKQVEEKIKKLNQTKDSLSADNEIPDEFMWMMKQSKMNPELLLMGIDKYAAKFDSIDAVKESRTDSLAYYKAMADSLKQQTAQLATAPPDTGSTGQANKYYFLVVGLVLGIAVTVVAVRKRS